jgi:hypothetical protein
LRFLRGQWSSSIPSNPFDMARTIASGPFFRYLDASGLH